MQILKKFTSLCDDSLILTYAAKAISVNINTAPREPRTSVSGPSLKQKSRTITPSRPNFSNSLSNLQKEAYKAFSWSRESASKSTPKEATRKRKSFGMTSDRVSWETMSVINEDQISSSSADVQERPAFVTATEEWILTGDTNKDAAIRLSHKYESSPDIILFKVMIHLLQRWTVYRSYPFFVIIEK